AAAGPGRAGISAGPGGAGAAADPPAADPPAAGTDRAGYVTLNLQRTRRIGRTYAPGADIRDAVAALREAQLWLALTEIWCGDSAQSLPCIAALAALDPRIDLRILSRDENLDIMDEYLTGGGRGIPKLIAFGARGEELFTWGPRPRAASELVAREKERGAPKEEILLRLHRWYAEDRCRSIEAELAERIRG
ncbi:MAG: thioredoxin family protein, partial [Candidatus Eisenbacteria bacterium]|nr:thioredoxin family protein [Candidatus Eisenbacteria bacterium]